VKQPRTTNEHAATFRRAAPVRVSARSQKQLEVFHEFARELGREAEERGLTEEALLADLEETKREVFPEHYGRVTSYDCTNPSR
jgi:hypothetical protein